MNNLLQLKVQFQHRKNPNKPGPVNLPKKTAVTILHMAELKQQLQNILAYWEENQTIIGGALVSVHYTHVIAKSNRLKRLLGEGSKSPNESIRGAKFVWGPEMEAEEPRQKHVFTHFVNLKMIRTSIENLETSMKVIQKKYGNQITDEDIDQINNKDRWDGPIAKTTFLCTVVDSYFVEKFDIDKDTNKIEEESIITIYKTGVETSKLLEHFGIDTINAKMIDETTLRLNPDEIRLIQENAPYLIAMNVKDFSEITLEDIIADESKNDKIIT